jgi:hypothetical protein
LLTPQHSLRYLPSVPDTPPPTTPATPTKPKGFFTKENARHYNAVGLAARKLLKDLRSSEDNPQQTTGHSTPGLNDFQSRRLVRVRAQLERIDYMLMTARGSKRIKELSDASARLSVQEFALAGRPLPGTKRPTSDDDGRRRARVESSMLVDEVAPAVGVPNSVTPSVQPLGWEYDDPNAVAPSNPPTTEDRLTGDVTP